MANTRAREAVGLCKENYPRPCGEDLAAIERACGVSNAENTQFRDRRQDMNQRLARKRRQQNRSFNPYQIRNKTWKDDHCQAHLFNPNINTLRNVEENIRERAGEMQEYLEDLIEDLPQEALEQAARSIPQRAARKTGCALLGPLAGACVLISTGYDLYELAGEAMDVANQIATLSDELVKLRDVVNQGDRIAQELRGVAGMSPEQAREQLGPYRQEVLRAQEAAAAANPCLRARRCFLTPHTNAGQQGSYNANRTQGRGTLMDGFGRGINSMDDPRGCCPGMTGHHLVYQSWTSPRDGNNPCPSFRGGQAPTVCVVGTNQNDAEHARIHNGADQMLQEHMEDFGCDFTINDAVNIGAESLHATLGGHCDKECLKEQLNQYYNTAGCGNNQLNAVKSDGTDIRQTDTCSAAMS